MQPLSFTHIIGQEKAKEILLRASRGGKVSHAYLFKGPAGVGKKSLAMAFASQLNCRDLQDDDSCGSCPSCKKFASGNHPDFVFIEPDGVMIKIAQIRALKKDLSFPPFEAKIRVVMLADIHTAMRRAEVANSLLKTLEEPPDDTVFILTADEASDILPTIASRCQVVPFYALPRDIVYQRLLDRGLAPEVARTLAAVCEGSFGRAVMLAENDLLALRRQVVEELSRLEKNKPDFVQVVFSLAERCAKLKENLEDLFDLLLLWIRDLMALHAPGLDDRLLNADLLHTYAQSRERWNLSELSDRLQKIMQAKKELIYNCNKAFVCEVLFFSFL